MEGPAKYCETREVGIAFNKGITSGIILSASILVQIYQEGAAEQLVKEASLSWGDLKKCKVDPFDRKNLRKIKEAFK